jgi:hypothetical protein
MNTSKIFAPLAGIAILLASSSAFVAACSSSDSNTQPGPTAHDSGSSAVDSGVGIDAGGSTDSGSLPDVDPNCHSDAANCNSCVTAQQDPYNACATATSGCVKFDNKTRVPANVPPVP